ncbi:unnamed protein product [Adineta steineri]|uniref:Transcription initiation factor IIF subunit alpha n=1 Tax=Adineta steineri TaxID=433720 RepID=A0A814DP52_9BILA|nr:unnamed protein product [Adineta steineri]CAF3841096.1 unnamed protein product [Adineta steineri]
MQPNSNRPVYIVQPSNITHLNVRPTIITTGGQQIQPQPQQPIYQISSVRPQTMPQQTSILYQAQSQPRLVASAPVYASLQQPQRFATSPQQQILTQNTNISPRPITPQTATRMPMVGTQSTTSMLRPTVATISTPPMATSTPAAAAAAAAQPPAAPGTKEFAVKVPKTRSQYGIMEFASGLSIDVKDWKAVEMRREINPYTYRPATAADPNSASASTITTSLGAVLPKTGAGSEYGREQKEALKRKRYATKGTNIEDLPWVLTDRSSTEKKLKHYRGLKKGGVTANSSYYVFIQGKDGFEAYPVEDWYGFSPTNVYNTLDFDEAEKQYQERHKHLSKWFFKHQVKSEKEGGDDIEHTDEKGKPSKTKNKREFKLLDAEDWINENEDDEDDDEGDDSKSNKKSKTKKTDSTKPKESWTLSDDDDEDEASKKPVKKAKTSKRRNSENQGEDSDDGDHEGDEVEYTSDESSDEDDRDANTAGASMKYEVKGVDEEVKNIPDMEKKLEQMDENPDGFDFDDDDEEIPDIEDNDEENDKTSAADLADVGKMLKSDAVSKDLESSSDDDDLDDSDDPDKEPADSLAIPTGNQPIPSEQVKTEKGHKKAKEEEMRAIKSTVMALPTTPANPSDTITEDKVRTLLLRKNYMTFTELIQNFLPKAETSRTKEVKEGIVQKLATILKRLNIEERTINGKKHIKLKSS